MTSKKPVTVKVKLKIKVPTANGGTKKTIVKKKA